MHHALKIILEIQELDMQMIELIKQKRERQNELLKIHKVKKELEQQIKDKEIEISTLKQNIKFLEEEVAAIKNQLSSLEEKQSLVKKVEEFNALSQEMARVEKEIHQKEQNLSDMFDTLATEEDLLKSYQEKMQNTSENSKVLEKEIVKNIINVNEEGKKIKEQRDVLTKQADKDVFAIYEKLLHNKKNRIVVAIEKRCCSGCHIMLTAQDENLARKDDHLTFCEHCSRILYWVDNEPKGTTTLKSRRRKRSVQHI